MPHVDARRPGPGIPPTSRAAVGGADAGRRRGSPTVFTIGFCMGGRHVVPGRHARPGPGRRDRVLRHARRHRGATTPRRRSTVAASAMEAPVLGLFGGADAGDPAASVSPTSSAALTAPASTIGSSPTRARRTASSTARRPSSPTRAPRRGTRSWRSSRRTDDEGSRTRATQRLAKRPGAARRAARRPRTTNSAARQRLVPSVHDPAERGADDVERALDEAGDALPDGPANHPSPESDRVATHVQMSSVGWCGPAGPLRNGGVDGRCADAPSVVGDRPMDRRRRGRRRSAAGRPGCGPAGPCRRRRPRGRPRSG